MHVGIAGAGLVGRLLAWRLIQQGHAVTLFDQDKIEGQHSCAFVAAGMLSPVTELAITESCIYEWGLQSLALWPEILASLSTPVFFQHQGSLLTAHRQDKAELDRFQKVVRSKLTNDHAIQLLSSQQARQLEPELALDQSTFYLPQEGQLDNQALLAALAHELQQQDAHWHPQTLVLNLTQTTVHTTQADFTFDQVFDCRGMGAQADIDGLRGVRGEIIYVQAPDVHLQHPVRLMHPRHPVYIVPKPNQLFAIGASEIDSEDTSSISVRTTLELLSAAYVVHPGFAEARILQTHTQLRPTFADHLPKIINDAGLIRINGLFRHGFLIAPALIEQVLSLTELSRSHA
ncbi:MAG: glycine oxidase ThiO [Legionellales bacterium]|nr:glycine oxidase ThiO [Legionellales bacterium]